MSYPEADSRQGFTTTHWSEIAAARTSTPERRQAVLNSLARRYWKPIYHYLRAKGHQDAEALDITQDFFTDIILGRDLLGRADPSRGRFRPYLLHCLKNFVRQRHRHDQALRRTPERPLVAMDQWSDTEHSGYQPPSPDLSPEEVFHQRWAASLLEQAIEKVRDSCRDDGLDSHFCVFEERVIRPTIEGTEPTPLEVLAQRFGLTTKQAANRAETIRRRFHKTLFEEVRLTVQDETVVNDEIQSLLAHLRR